MLGRRDCHTTAALLLSPQCTEVRFTSLLSGGFITAILVNPPERNLAKRTSVQWSILQNPGKTMFLPVLSIMVTLMAHQEVL